MKSGANYGSLKEQISELIAEKMKKAKITGLSLALVDDQDVVLSAGFGYADKEKHIQADSKTLFRICSMTKVFTGTAIMKLVDEGKIDLDKSVKEYIPEFHIKTRYKNPAVITVRSLMTHHSGLPCDNRSEFFVKDIKDNPTGYRSSIKYLKEHYAAYPPGYIWSYSNLGANLLALIVERVSGVDYCEFIKKEIFKPLNMKSSCFPTDDNFGESMLKPYSKGKAGLEYSLRDLPAGGIVSNVQDLSNFIKMIIASGTFGKDEIISSDSLNEMHMVQNSNVTLDLGFKMGLNWILDWPALEYAGKVCWHDGGSIHYNTLMVILPEQKLGLVLLSNSEDSMLAIRDIAEETLINAVEIKSGIKFSNINYNGLVKINSNFKNYEGIYATMMGPITVHSNNTSLRLTMMEKTFDMIPNGDGWFSLKLRLLGVLPVNIKQLQNMKVAINNINHEKVFLLSRRTGRTEFRQAIGKETTIKTISESWQNRTGKYDIVEKDNDLLHYVNLQYNNGILSIKGKARKMGMMNFVLEPVSENEAIILGLGRYLGETISIKDEDGKHLMEIFGLEFTKAGGKS